MVAKSEELMVRSVASELLGAQLRRFFRPEGAVYRSPGQRPGVEVTTSPEKPCRGDLVP